MALPVWCGERLLLAMSNKVVTVSKGVAEELPSKHREHCIILPNGVDIEAVRSVPSTSPVSVPPNHTVIGFVGNWESVMHIEDICEAALLLDNTIAVIVGEGYRAQELYERYADEKRVIFTGKLPREQAYAVLRDMDVCVLPYDGTHYMSMKRDFFSNRKIAEYLAAGKPIVASDIAGLPDILLDGQSCLLYPPGDVVELAHRVEKLIKDGELYRRMSVHNYELAEKFSWKGLVERSGLLHHLGCSEEVIGKKKY